MTQTSVVKEALAANPRMGIEDIIRYGMEKYSIVIREHTVFNVFRKAAQEEEATKLLAETEALKAEVAKLKLQLGQKKTKK